MQRNPTDPNHLKIIFLDVDGVLNNDSTKEFFKLFRGLDQRLVKMFVTWYRQQDLAISICLSSTWRIDNEFKQHLADNGIQWLFETPQLGSSTRRGHEIEHILEQFKPSHYAILDDLGPSEFLKHQRSHLVQTSPKRGLEPSKLRRIEEILGDTHETYSCESPV